MEAAAEKLCACGHRMGGHFERRTTYEAVLHDDGSMTVVEHTPADYKVGRFFCEVDGCDCHVDR